MRRLGRRRGLDGLRAIAVAMVVAYHAFPRLFPGGELGVEVFFVLSGFLITWTLLDEFAERGDIRLPAFYARRALRLLPALAVLLAVYLIVGIVAYSPHSQRSMMRSALVAATYGTDWVLAFGYPISAGLGHLWSLAVEEQFYLLWPLVLVGMVRRGLISRVAIVAASLAVLSAVTREVLWHRGATMARLYFAFDTRCSSLLVGCALAAALACGRMQRASKPSFALNLCAAWAALLLAVPLVRNVPPIGQGSPLSGFFAIALSVAVILLWTVAQDGQGWARVLDSPVATYVGRRSYGIYLWHYTLFQLGRTWFSSESVVATVGVIMAALVAAHLSFRFVEQPALRLRHRFAHRDTKVGGDSSTQGIVAIPLHDFRPGA